MGNNKVFYDQEGNECSLYKLVRSEPGWAESRILEGMKYRDEVMLCSSLIAENRNKINALEDILQRLVDLKSYKDQHGKTNQYTTAKLKAWEDARGALKR